MEIHVPRNILIVSLKLLNEKLIDFHQHKRKKFVSFENEKKIQEIKKNYMAKYGHLAKYGSWLCDLVTSD